MHHPPHYNYFTVKTRQSAEEFLKILIDAVDEHMIDRCVGRVERDESTDWRRLHRRQSWLADLRFELDEKLAEVRRQWDESDDPRPFLCKLVQWLTNCKINVMGAAAEHTKRQLLVLPEPIG